MIKHDYKDPKSILRLKPHEDTDLAAWLWFLVIVASLIIAYQSGLILKYA